MEAIGGKAAPALDVDFVDAAEPAEAALKGVGAFADIGGNEELAFDDVEAAGFV